MAVLVGSALVVAPIVTAVQAEAGGTPPDFFICVGGAVFDDAVDSPENVLTPGADADIVVGIELQEWEAGKRPVGFDDGCEALPAGVTPTTAAEVVLRLIDPAEPTPALDWTVLDTSLVGGATVPAVPEDVTWTLNVDLKELRTVNIDKFDEFDGGTLYDPHPDGFTRAITLSSAIFVTVSDDLSPGTYVLNVEVIVDDGTSTFSFSALVPFEVVAAASSTTVSPTPGPSTTVSPPPGPSTPVSPPPGPSTTVSCGEPVAGAVVMCTLRSVEEFDFLWEASTNPVFTGGIVTTDAAGVGEFSFLVPADAVGQEVLVRIVDWTRAEPIGVASPPVPSSVPAGERGEVPVGMLVILLLGVVALLGGMARVPTEVGGVSRVSR